MNSRTLPTVRALFLSLLVLPLLALLAAPAAAAEPLPAPDLTGVWTGKITGKHYSQETGDKPVAVKFLVEATITQIGDAITIDATLTDTEGDEYAYYLQGKTGNRQFWAFNGESGEPILILGKVAGKLPKLSISGKGVEADEDGFAELKVSLKRSKAGVLGTSAKGAAVAGATVTLKDRFGNSDSTTTDSEGRYSLNVVGFTPPFLVKVDPTSGPDLFGYASVAGVANVTPITDLILRTWYDVQDLELGAEFASLNENTPVPTAIDIALLESLLRRVLALWLDNNGVDSETFNFFTTPFDADGSGVDAVLDDTSVVVESGGGSISVDDGTTTQSSNFEVNDVTGTVTVDSTTTSPGGTSQSTDGTALAGESDAMAAAVAGAVATMEAFRNKINSRGENLSVADIQGFGTTDFLDDGRNRTLWFGGTASDLRGGSLDPFILKSIRDYDNAAGILDLEFELHLISQEGEGTERFRMQFKKVGSAWLMYGNRQICELSVHVEFRTSYFHDHTDGPSKHINVDIRAATGSISSVTVTGAGVFDATPVPKSEYTDLNEYEPTPGTEVQYESDAFFTGADFEEYPAPGTPVIVTVTPTGGSPVEYTVYTGATTTEAISFSGPTGHDWTTDAHPGTPVNAEWSLPSSFAIRRFQFRGDAFSETHSVDVVANGDPQIGDTSGSITFPGTVGGQPSVRGGISLGFDGPNGERIKIDWDFQEVPE